MLCVVDKNLKEKKIQLQVIEILNSTNYSLNVVNRYKENIIHVSAANDCVDVIKCILQKHDKNCLERKNSFGWTPLMHAIRNENMEMVKFLLSCGANVNDFSFLGMSVLTLASAISNNMFDLLYKKYPSALECASQDDINPLCIAALKNDKKLFFKLVHLGLSVERANAFTHAMMRQSTESEIAVLAKSYSKTLEDYWNDISDIEEQLRELENSGKDSNSIVDETVKLETAESVPKILVQVDTESLRKVNKNSKNLYLNLIDTNCKLQNSISPTLSHFNEFPVPVSPRTFMSEVDSINSFTKLELEIDKKENALCECGNRHFFEHPEKDTSKSSLGLLRCQSKRPPNLKIRNSSNDSNATLSFTPQFSPIRSPNLPKDFNEDNIFDETTPTPPRYKTPPRGIILDPSSKELVILLKKFGLKRHVPIILEQEVDLDLFLTLTDRDLIEIGIDKKSERLIILSVINECKGVEHADF